MKKITFLLCFCLCSLLAFGQKYALKTTIFPQKVWTFDGRTLPEGINLLKENEVKVDAKKTKTLPPAITMKKVVAEILTDTTYKQNFILFLAEVIDVVAVIDGEQRYILYSPSFESQIISTQDPHLKAKLAHEMAYHLVKGISFMTVNDQVLTADLFAAYSVGKTDAINPETLFANIPEYKIGNYPTKEKRIQNLNEKAAFIYAAAAAKADSTAKAQASTKSRSVSETVANLNIDESVENMDSILAVVRADSAYMVEMIKTLSNNTTNGLDPLVLQAKSDSMPQTEVEWIIEEYDFGNIKEGEKVTYPFTFKNKGKNDLVIWRVKPSCGCTAVDWLEEPIKPKKKGYAKIVFDSHNKAGEVTKTITVYGNFTGGAKELHFKGTVLPNPDNHN